MEVTEKPYWRCHPRPGVSINYNTIHKWNLRKNGKATRCENINCFGVSKKYEWSLIHGKPHTRDIKNYYQLCKQCHALYDLRKIKIIISPHYLPGRKTSKTKATKR